MTLFDHDDIPSDGVSCISCGDVEDRHSMQHGEEIGESGPVCRYCVKAWHAQVRRDAQDGVRHPLERDEVAA